MYDSLNLGNGQYAITKMSFGFQVKTTFQVLKNCDELFNRDEFSAAPDAGWPDCFNSGVFVFKPSIETFKVFLLEFDNVIYSLFSMPTTIS